MCLAAGHVMLCLSLPSEPHSLQPADLPLCFVCLQCFLPPAARFADQAPEPFDKEVTLCDQLASYLRKFVVAEEAAAEVVAKDLSGALEGFKPLEVQL